MSVQQIQSYRNHNGTAMFFSLHPGDVGKAKGVAVLMAPAIFEEKQDAHRAMVNFAHQLAEEGVTVLRFDYRGQGESSGDLHEFSPTDLVDDICFAFQELQKSGDYSTIGAIGVRFGGNLLAAAAEKIKPAYVVGWAPVYDGENYAKTILWTNLTTQMMIHRKIVEDRTVLLSKLEKGELIDVDGYKLNLEWYRYLCNDDLAGHLAKAGVDAKIFDITADPEQENSRWNDFVDRLTGSGVANIAAERIKGDTFWRLTPLYAVRPKETFQKTEEFIAEYVSR